MLISISSNVDKIHWYQVQLVMSYAALTPLNLTIASIYIINMLVIMIVYIYII